MKLVLFWVLLVLHRTILIQNVRLHLTAEQLLTESHLEVKATVPGIDAAKFAECAAEAKANCPISKLLNTNITMEASLA